MTSWDAYWRTVGNETWLYVRELLELTESPKAHFAGFITPVNDARDWNLDWKAAAAAADEWPCSSTERRMLDLVLSLINPDEEHGHRTEHDEDGYYTVPTVEGTRKIDARDLGSMGSWRDDVAAILARYITGQPPKRVD
jgi:hypothetical protein